jgi:hypothetical protein
MCDKLPDALQSIGQPIATHRFYIFPSVTLRVDEKDVVGRLSLPVDNEQEDDCYVYEEQTTVTLVRRTIGNAAWPTQYARAT